MAENPADYSRTGLAVRYLIEPVGHEVVLVEMDIESTLEANAKLKASIKGLRGRRDGSWGTPHGSQGIIYRSDEDERPVAFLSFNDSGSFIELNPIDPTELIRFL